MRAGRLGRTPFRNSLAPPHIAPFTFFLGTHIPAWLAETDVPLFVSRRRLARLEKHGKSLPRARGAWALDSGGFSELSLFGHWTITVQHYVREVRRWISEIGNMQWAASADYMCEPFILEKTGLTVAEHQRRTIVNYQRLLEHAPELPWVPVIQGYAIDEYHRHVDQYDKAGIDLRKLPVVGVGSVCRRQETDEAVQLFRELYQQGISAHAFGFSTPGLLRSAQYLTSADSMAWSYQARQRPPLPECVGKHKSCQHCMTYALRWRERLVQRLSINNVFDAADSRASEYPSQKRHVNRAGQRDSS